eukprot:maker-scaffold40_size501252-snap-gene-0.14 protein:Tk06157 transcript:maker-scaffold40_size501252-snap-gene-0.14-mRNA-1 annotation:"transcriptional repressor ctcf-like isoform x2"
MEGQVAAEAVPMAVVTEELLASVGQWGVTGVSLGAWVLFLRSTIDVFDAQNHPVLSIVVLVRPATGEYVARALSRCIASGVIKSEWELKSMCQKYLVDQYPCLGIQGDVAHNTSAHCAQVMSLNQAPVSWEDLICDQCAQTLPHEGLEDTKETGTAVKVEDLDQLEGWLEENVKVEMDPEGDSAAQDILADIIGEDPCVTFANEAIFSTDLKPDPADLPVKTRVRPKRALKRPCPPNSSNKPASPSPTRPRQGARTKSQPARNQFTLPGRKPLDYKVEWKGKIITFENPLKPRGSPWQCPICSSSCRYQHRFGHLKQAHHMYKLHCPQCSEEFLCPFILSDHIRETHPDRLVAHCRFCFQDVDIAESRDQLQEHLQPCHRKEVHGKNLTKNTEYNKVRKLTDKRQWQCETCGIKYNQCRHLKDHVRAVHEAKKDLWTCPVCAKIISIRGKYGHLREVHFYAKFACQECTTKERTSLDMSNHMLMAHPSATHTPCPECKASILAQDLINHHQGCLSEVIAKRKKVRNERINAQPHQFICPVCSKGFPIKYQMNTHMRTHKQSCFNCEQCPYRTFSKDHLEEHIQNHHMDQTDCFQCDAKFPTSEDLWRHLRENHDVTTLAPCAHCNAIFKDNRNLRAHLYRQHETKEAAVFKCSSCNFEATTQKALKTHFDTFHSPTFTCELCEEHFNNQDLLKKHMRNDHATQQITYKCNHCKQTFRFKNDLFSHLSSAHNLKLANESLTSIDVNAVVDPSNAFLTVINPNVIHTTHPVMPGSPEIIDPNVVITMSQGQYQFIQK